MKTINQLFTASALALLVAGSASAAIYPDLERDVRSAAGANSNVLTSIEGDTVILRGFVANKSAYLAIEQAARDNGAEIVINGVQWE